MLCLTVPAIALLVYIALFKEDFKKEDLDILIPVCIVVMVVFSLIEILSKSL